MDNDRPIIFTITFVTSDMLEVSTKDRRWKEEDLTMTFEHVPPCNLFSCMEALTCVGNSKHYSVIFEVE